MDYKRSDAPLRYEISLNSNIQFLTAHGFDIDSFFVKHDLETFTPELLQFLISYIFSLTYCSISEETLQNILVTLNFAEMDLHLRILWVKLFTVIIDKLDHDANIPLLLIDNIAVVGTCDSIIPSIVDLALAMCQKIRRNAIDFIPYDFFAAVVANLEETMPENYVAKCAQLGCYIICDESRDLTFKMFNFLVHSIYNRIPAFFRFCSCAVSHNYIDLDDLFVTMSFEDFEAVEFAAEITFLDLCTQGINSPSSASYIVNRSLIEIFIDESLSYEDYDFPNSELSLLVIQVLKYLPSGEIHELIVDSLSKFCNHVFTLSNHQVYRYVLIIIEMLISDQVIDIYYFINLNSFDKICTLILESDDFDVVNSASHVIDIIISSIFVGKHRKFSDPEHLLQINNFNMLYCCLTDDAIEVLRSLRHQENIDTKHNFIDRVVSFIDNIEEEDDGD